MSTVKIKTEPVVEFESIDVLGAVCGIQRMPVADMACNHGYASTNSTRLFRVSRETAAELRQILDQHKISTDTLRLEIDAMTEGDNHAEPDNS